MEDTTNLFLMFDLDPGSVPDEKAIDAAILAKRKQWSNEQNNSKAEVKRRAKKYLQRLNPKMMKEVLLDPQTREEEARKAKDEIRQCRESKRKELEDAIELLSKGAITEESIKRIAQQFKDYYYTEKDVRERLARKESAAGPAGEGDEGVQPLDSSMADFIRQNLKIVGKNGSLYEFLGFDKDGTGISSATLRAKAVDLERQLRSKSVITPEDDARRDLIGHCLDLFKDDSKRARYDATLALEKLMPLLALIDNACRVGTVEIGQLLLLLRKGEELEVARAKVLAIVKKKVRQRRAQIMVDPALDFESGVRCVCSFVNKPLAEQCEKCSQPLYYVCPKCKCANEASNAVCSCGFSVQAVVGRLEAAHRSGQLERFIEIWDTEADRTHPIFHKWINEANDIRSRIEEKRRTESELREKMNLLEQALNKDDDAGIVQWWDEALLALNPALAAVLPRIRKAHVPPDVDGVDAIHERGGIRVSWNVSERVNEYVVTWSTDGFPKNPAEAMERRVTRSEYEAHGFKIPNPEPRAHYIVVFAVSTFRGDALSGPGASGGCRFLLADRTRQTIRYSLRVKSRPFKRKEAVLVLRSERDVESVPELVLVARPGRVLPIDAQGGRVVERISGISLAAGQASERRIDLSGVTSPARLRLFVAGPQPKVDVVLMPDDPVLPGV